jgi:hypothetical protein
VKLRAGLLLIFGLDTACKQSSPAPPKSLAPAPLPSLEANPAAPESPIERPLLWGSQPPQQRIALRLEGGRIRISPSEAILEEPIELKLLLDRIGHSKPVLLEPNGDTYLAQVAPLLSALDDARVEIWLAHPDQPIAFKLLLRDQKAFQQWLDEAKPGKIRIIQRTDGLELQTNIGKLPGPDPNGPTIPARAGRLDIARLRNGLEKLKGRFGSATDACVVPSFGTELRHIAEALSGFYRGPGDPIFREVCLVYPRENRG